MEQAFYRLLLTHVAAQRPFALALALSLISLRFEISHNFFSIDNPSIMDHKQSQASPNPCLFGTTPVPRSAGMDTGPEEYFHKPSRSHSLSIPKQAQLAPFTSLEQLSSPPSFSPTVPRAGAADFQPLSLPSIDQPAALTDTPLKARVSSYDGDHKSYLKGNVTCRDMGPVLSKEVHAGLQEHVSLGERLFPKLNDSSIASVLSKMSVWRSTTNTWKYSLETTKTNPRTQESRTAQWLNAIGAAYSEVTKLPVLRHWVANTCNTPVSGASSATGPLHCKPDIALLDIESALHLRPTWSGIHAFGEVTSQDSFHLLMQQTVYVKSHVMFSTQESRRFVCSLAFFGRTKVRFNVIDREGHMYQDISLLGRLDHGCRLLHVVAGFMCGNLAGLGYDSTVNLHPDGSINTIRVTDRTYRVVKKLHVATGIIGRCTRVWLAHHLDDPHNRVVIKDSWPLLSRSDLEEKALRRLQGIPGIPVIEQIATVQFTRRQSGSSYEDSTALLRQYAVGSSPSHRIHRRVVMSSVGLKLTNFRCLSELIGAFRDVIIGE